MTPAVILRRRAEQDLEAARAWYEAQENGLGDAFLTEVRERLENIRDFPKAYPTIYRNIRRAVIQRFPYLVFYLETPAKVVVLAVLHASRDPAHWPRQ